MINSYSKSIRVHRRSALGATVAAVLAVGAAAAPAGAAGTAGAWGPKDGKGKGGQYADVNGIKLYYQVHGKGQPLVLLHGGLGAIEMFGPNLTALARGRKVIALDLQGHGRTADIDRPFSLEAMADDVAALLQHLHIPKADVMGYSLGGGVALQTAIRHPALVDRLVVASAPIKRKAFHADILAQQGQVTGAAAEAMKATPMYQVYAALAPRKEDWPRLLDKIGQFMKKDYDYSEQVKAIKHRTLIVAGDSDIFPIAHAVEVFNLLGGGLRDGGWDGSGLPNAQLAVLPGLTHYNTFSSPALAAAVIPFLDQKPGKLAKAP